MIWLSNRQRRPRAISQQRSPQKLGECKDANTRPETANYAQDSNALGKHWADDDEKA
jgi:hypothetical protein